ncbi:ATPase [Novosphingobium sp.]|uniref:ATPase n=1 Tax=Novosphingobium sp. TaxID=1874826 RepID=UPI0027335FD0|nr:ATPase [Novosphingobium sp.]MDP3906040.1 ATPase [Novosphingobium sp.]
MQEDEPEWGPEWAEDMPQRAPRNWFGLIAAALAVAAIAGWSALFFIVNRANLSTGGTPAQWSGWIRDWSIPVLLVAALWLVAMRNSRREATRFGDAARLLANESTRLEQRLITVNRELSLAREFIAAQSRDLEALGRMAGERLSEHAAQLASLIQDNGTRIDTIGTVSEAALDNMEKLRSQLPVIASSAKDVTNNIGNAGRTAHSQLEDMVSGFNKLNQFGQASERQVRQLRELVDQTLAEFTRQADQMETTATQRFAALHDSGAEFRTQLETAEVEALGAVRSRAQALHSELDAARALLDSHEAESLTSLRSRLTAVRDESAAIARSLRDGEGAATDAWHEAVTRLETDLREAIDRVGAIDEKAMESARARLAQLADEAETVDKRMAERDQLFSDELERRQTDMDARQTAFIAALRAQMGELDAELTARQAEHEQQSRALVDHTETISSQLGQFSQRMREIAEHGGTAKADIAAALETLTQNLAASRQALAGTDSAIAGLTDDSVRLLELIQASMHHSAEELPAAIRISDARLAELETRALSLRSTLEVAESRGEALGGYVRQSKADLADAVGTAEHLQAAMHAQSTAQAATLTQLHSALEIARSASEALAEQAQTELRGAIDALTGSARDAVAGIETMSAAAIAALADRLGEASGAAIEQAMRTRAAEIAGQLEQAAAHAAGVSREAAVQLRDQLAKVNELAGNLERRVAQTRARAEEQVDNDFARRVALITESLNSNAIDIARALDSDVTDTAWAAYLKGDRGVFTRRAVRLIDNPEAKAIVALYEGDRDFRDHVSRYIHDFEAMLRQLLSTRDGHALSVTLLSSDMGKLYVVLAQAIERLRN